MHHLVYIIINYECVMTKAFKLYNMRKYEIIFYFLSTFSYVRIIYYYYTDGCART